MIQYHTILCSLAREIRVLPKYMHERELDRQSSLISLIMTIKYIIRSHLVFVLNESPVYSILYNFHFPSIIFHSNKYQVIKLI